MDNNSIDDMMKSMLGATQKRETDSNSQQQEQKAKEEAHQKLQRVTNERRDDLINILATVIDEFNRRSPSGQISVSKQGNRIEYSLPLQQEGVTLEFFTVDPPLNLSGKNLGIVSFAGYLEGHRGMGRNFLWCHQNLEDLQGKWVTCRVTTHAGVRPRPGRKPYGIVYGFEDEKGLHEIEVSISGSHVYEVSFEDDIQKEFTQVLYDAMKIT